MSESRVRIAANLVGLACALAVATGAGGQTGSTGPASRPAEVPKAVEATAARDQAASNDDGLVIGPTELPNTYPHGVYVVTLQPRGKFVPPLHWRVERGAAARDQAGRNGCCAKP